jgi:hypothetical protein
MARCAIVPILAADRVNSEGRTFMKSLKQAIALAAMAGLFTAGALAEEPASQPAAATNAMRVVVDPVTGEVRAPTDTELQALIAAEKAARAAEKAQRATSRAAATTAQQVMPEQKSVVRHPNGMVSMRMSQDSLSALKVEKDANGKTHLVHEGETLQSPKAEEK